MKCAKFKDNLIAYVEGLLEESAREAMEEHLKSCEDCRRELSEVSELHNKLVENGNRFAGADYENDVMDRIVREQTFKLRKIEKSGKRIPIGKFILSSKVMRFAAAAVIIAAVLIGLVVDTEIALAEVLAQVENIKNVIYRMRGTIKGLPGVPTDEAAEINSNIKLSYVHGGCRVDTAVSIREETIKQKVYVLFEDGVIYSVLDKQKKYLQLELTEELLEKMEEERGDPMTLLKEMTKYEYTDLGNDTIDGVKVWGLKVANPGLGSKMGALVSGGMFDEASVELWVDVKTKLPVRMIIRGSSKKGEIAMDLVIDGFEWDVEIDASEFEPNIPEDYDLLGEAKWDTGNEGEGIIEVLTFFSEYSHGNYPSSLAGMTVIMEFSEWLQAEFAKNPPPSGEPPKELIEKLVNAEMVGMMYNTLAEEGKEPAYYGDKVTAEFAHAVLFRWKVSDDMYRVVFGDLTTRDVDAEELAELEALPLNIEPFAIKPVPAVGAIGTAVEGMGLSWMGGNGAVSHRVYLGVEGEELALIDEVTTESVELTSLERGVTYYWRIDEVTADGTVTAGDVWNFNTGGLVGWWKLDEASGDTVYDSSGNGYDGGIAGDPNWVEGVSGGALGLDGDGDYVDLGSGEEFDITEQITLAAWIKVGSFEEEWQNIISKGDKSYRLQKFKDQDTLEFACTGVLVPGTRWSNIRGSTSVNDGQWHHVAGVWDGVRMSLYVDGELDAASTASGVIDIVDKAVYIGENSEEDLTRCWNGMIDDVRIYSYGLSEAEIKSLAAEGE
jgi:hypothetical protein